MLANTRNSLLHLRRCLPCPPPSDYFPSPTHQTGPKVAVEHSVRLEYPVSRPILCSFLFPRRISHAINWFSSTSICSAIKSYHLAKLPKSTDFTWASYDVYAWHTGESFAILFCGTIPILKPVHDFIRRQKILSSWREGWKSRSSKSTTQKTSSRSWSDHRVQIGTISSHELGKYRWDETDRESTRVLVGKYGDI